MTTMKNPHTAPPRAGRRGMLLAANLGISIGLGLSIGALACAQSLCPPGYEITEWFKGPRCGIFGDAGPIPLGINDPGQIVGYYKCPTGPDIGFRRDPNGAFVTLPTPSGFGLNRAWDINNAGQITGTVSSGSPPRAYRRTGSVYTLIEPPEGWWGTEARAINGAGVVVGAANSDPQANPWQPFVWDGQSLTVIPVLTGVRGWALDINDHGVAVGWMGYNPTIIAEPFIWNGKEAVLLPLPEGAFTGQATAINNHGDILVAAVMNEGLPNIVRPYLWRDGEYTALPFLEDYGRCYPFDINDDGVAVGFCDNGAGPTFPISAIAWVDGEVINLRALGGGAVPVYPTDAYAVNASGMIASVAVTLGGLVYGAVVAPTPSIPADIDRDGTVGVADLGVLLGAWGATDSPADLNCDGLVNGADLGVLLLNWGPVR